MRERKRLKPDPMAKLFAKLHPTEDELAALKAAERDPQLFVRAVGELDRKYKARTLSTLGLARKLVNERAFRASGAQTAAGPRQRALPGAGLSLVARAVAEKQARNDSVVPFAFSRLDVYTSMSGPETNEVERGMIGAMRWGANEYSVWNPGDTNGKTRVHVHGQMHLSFRAAIPEAGRWCLFHPAGDLLVRGHSRVVGHGNSTTSYDAKVWVDYYQVLELGTQLLEISGGGIHYDGTRSEDRTKAFNGDLSLPARTVYFDAAQPGDLLLTMRLEIDTAANEDGIATGVVDQFGFLANSTDEYDTIVMKA